MKKPLRSLYVAAIVSCLSGLFVACEQEAENPQWDIEILGPVLHAEIGINQLLADSLTQSDGDGKLRVVFESTYDNLETDSVYSIPDTVFPNPIPNTLGISFTVNPGSSIPVSQFITKPYLTIGSQNTPLRSAIVESGKIRVTFQNYYNTRLFFTYTFPKVTINGSPVILTDTADSGTISSPNQTTTDIDITGAHLDLTGLNGDLFNSIYYTLSVNTDPQGPSIAIRSDTIIRFNTELIGIEPYYVSGYFGQKDFTLDEDIVLGDGRIFQSGTLYLDNATLSLDLENGIGADLSAYVSSLTSINTATGNQVPLVATSILRQNINLARASETGNTADPVHPTRATFLINKQNSNLPDFLRNLPDRIGTDLRLSLNPLGNVSGNYDFVYKDHLVRTKSRLEIPLRLAADALTLVDTQDFAETNLNDLEALGPATFTLIAENGFPIDVRLNLEILDQSGNISDQLLVPDIIPAGITDADLKVVQPVTTRIRIPVDAVRKQHLLDASRIVIVATFTTVNTPQLLDLYDHYRLKLKLITDAVYSIR